MGEDGTSCQLRSPHCPLRPRLSANDRAVQPCKPSCWRSSADSTAWSTPISPNRCPRTARSSSKSAGSASTTPNCTCAEGNGPRPPKSAASNASASSIPVRAVSSRSAPRWPRSWVASAEPSTAATPNSPECARRTSPSSSRNCPGRSWPRCRKRTRPRGHACSATSNCLRDKPSSSAARLRRSARPRSRWRSRPVHA